MFNKFNLNENEVTRILLMHKSLREQKKIFAPDETLTPAPTEKNNASKTTEEPLVPATSEKTEKPIDIKSELEKIKGYGCFRNEAVIVQTNRTEPNRQWAIKQESKKTPGKFGYFFYDKSIGEIDTSGKFGIITQKWECAKLKEMQNLEAQKQAFIDTAKASNYKTDLTPAEIASGKYKESIFPGSEKFFPPNGLKIYWSASDAKSKSTDNLNTFEEIKNAQTIDKNKCKKIIKSYYDAFKTKKDIPQFNFDITKNDAQRCVNDYENKWGGFLGLGNIKKYVEIMRGGIGGPSRAGDDSKWRLN